MKIALHGKMMSGKTIVADYLVSKYGFIEFAFADRLKDLAVELFGMQPEDKDRELLQLLGMKMRVLDPHVWIRYVMNEIPEWGDIVVSDVRLLNEFDALRNSGFMMVKCFVGEKEQKKRIQMEMPDMCDYMRFHKSETELDGETDWDYTLVNDGCSMKELLGQVNSMIKLFKGELSA